MSFYPIHLNLNSYQFNTNNSDPVKLYPSPKGIPIIIYSSVSNEPITYERYNDIQR